MTVYLTDQHVKPPRVIEHEGINYPVTRLIELEDTATLVTLGVYPHIYLDPSIPAPLGTDVNNLAAGTELLLRSDGTTMFASVGVPT